MFDLDKWHEIFSTLKKNKLRTFLTSFSVAWGILLLIILLGAGNGLRNGVMHNFKDEATNSIWIWSGRTSIEHKGLGKDRSIKFTNKDFETIKTQIEGIDHISAQFTIWNSSTTSYKKEYGNFTVRCAYPDFKFIEKINIEKGRFINNIDIKQKRKVAAIGGKVIKTLFKDENPLGKYIKINNISFKVVGLYKDEGRDNDRIYLPFSAAQQIFNGGVRVHNMSLTTGKASVEESKEIESKIRRKLASIHQFDPKDKSAIGMFNSLKEYEQTLKVMMGIKLFVWLIGIGTIIAGIVGVSNIMLIVVKERTREIGVRKALGATPFSVVSLIISEAVFITTIAGYVGMVIGVAIMEVVDFFMDKSLAAQASGDGIRETIFMNPNADIGIAVGATILLVVSGAIAGLIPAIRAAKIRPIEALRYE